MSLATENIRRIWKDCASFRGWSQDTQVELLITFIEFEPELVEDLLQYIRAVCEEEDSHDKLER